MLALAALASAAALACSSGDTVNEPGSPGPVDDGSGNGNPGVGNPGGGSDDDHLTERAYVVSRDSGTVFVVNIDQLEAVGTIDLDIGGGHMANLNPAGDRLYVVASEENEIAVVDTRKLEFVHSIPVEVHPTHVSTCFNCLPDLRDELWVVNEDSNSVSVIDMATDEVIDTIVHESLVVPHNVRFSSGYAYIPSIAGNQVTVVDLETRVVSDVLTLEGIPVGECAGDPCGFADAQIDGNGLLVAAHIETGKVLMYDTLTRQTVKELSIGNQPWAAFVDVMSNAIDTVMMPNWGDSTVSVIDRVAAKEVARPSVGDVESYGVNYSPLAPDRAFVLNRVKEQVAVVDRNTAELLDSIDVGGTTETGSVTEDGKYLILPISSADALVIVDIETEEIIKRFENVGDYPWSVVTMGGQNYCH